MASEHTNQQKHQDTKNKISIQSIRKHRGKGEAGSTHHLPDLQNVVLGHGGDHPGVVRAPAEVRHLRGVPAVLELRIR
eukprot:3188166-Rhodomonas_salina.1